MKNRRWLLLLLLLVLAAPFPTRAVGPVDTPDMTLAPPGRQIEIAVTGDPESDPAIAVCRSKRYLAVYERGGNIMGQRLEADGTLLGGAFQISDGDKPASNPDVACEWTHDLFVVVWESDFTLTPLDRDIRAQAVYGAHQSSGSQLRSSWLYVGSSFNDELNPALACNHHDQTCLAVYESGPDSSIRGRRIEVAGTGDAIAVPQASFEVTSATSEYEPDVAWSGADRQFMVVWQHWWVNVDPPSHLLLTFRPFHDTHQAVNQWQTPEYGLVKFSCGLAHGQMEPAIAYSRGSGEYLVAFQYDYYGDATDFDIAAIHLEPSGTRGCPFYVAETSSSEAEPVVAYCGGPEYIMVSHAPQFLVAYRRIEPGANVLAAQRVEDSDDGSGVLLVGSTSVLDHVAGSIRDPDVTGSAHTGRYLTVWHRNTGGQYPELDILGYMVAPYATHLPLVLRHHE